MAVARPMPTAEPVTSATFRVDDIIYSLGQALFNERIKDPHLPPVGLILGDELQVGRIGLIGIMGRTAREDNMQTYVEIADIDRPGQLRFYPSASEIADAGLHGEVLFAGRNHRCHIRW